MLKYSAILFATILQNTDYMQIYIVLFMVMGLRITMIQQAMIYSIIELGKIKG
jgi:hypothetical protein